LVQVRTWFLVRTWSWFTCGAARYPPTSRIPYNVGRVHQRILPWLPLVVGFLMVAFARRLGRGAVQRRIGTPFVSPEVAFIPARRKLEEDWYGSWFSAGGVVFILASLWILRRAYFGSD
jgi:hypothetical protein